MKYKSYNPQKMYVKVALPSHDNGKAASGVPAGLLYLKDRGSERG